MATWHQAKAGVTAAYAPDAEDFVCVTDKPGEMLCRMGFSNQEAAQAYAATMRGRGWTATIVPPAGAVMVDGDGESSVSKALL